MYAPRSRFLLLGVVIGAVIFFVPSLTAQNLPALPQSFVNTTYPVSTGITTNVPAGGDLQGALDQAQLGDTILLAAGATYSGSFTLRSKVGSGWIIIRTAAPDSSLPPAGNRITPSYASALPKLVASSSTSVVKTAPGAHHYRFTGVEFTLASGVSMTTGLVQLGDGGGAQSSLSSVPYSIVLDRVYLHGNSSADLRRGVGFNCASCAVIDSYISDVHERGADSQAIGGWNGPGPFKIVNNYLEGAGENVMFGGADPHIPNLVPSDIEVRGNYVHKPASWRSSSWSVKNLFELKNARRVLIDGNIFEHNWPQAQNGFSILFTPRNQDGGAPWSVVEDVTFTNNIVRHVAAAMNISGGDNIHPSAPTKRILVRNNVFEDVNAATWGGSGRLFQILKAMTDLTIDHNTAFHSGEIIFTEGPAHTRFIYRNNLTPHNQYGVAGTGTTGNPANTLSTFFPGAVFVRNVLAGGNASSYPADNFFPASMSNVGFVNLAGGNYRLQSSSPYRNAGTDGKDLGADIDAVAAATAGVINGGPPSPPPPPPPPDQTPPSVSITAPVSGAGLSGVVTISANAADNIGVAGVQFFVDGTALNAEDTAAPHQTSWDTTTASNGAHTLTAQARDAAGNRTTSSAVAVTVNNVSPDTTAPSVSITAPANGATVSSTITFSANASDNVGVAGVQFYVDGNALGAEDTSLPYQVSWDTRAVSNGSHALTAQARDAAGNRTTSGSVSVTVSNAPAVQSPYSGTPIPLPGRFEAEDFDRGGEGVAYHDLSPGNQGGLYRATEDVDIISPYVGGYVVNNFQTGEWLEYTINVSQSGTYGLELLASSQFTTSRFHIEVDGADKTGVIDVPSTGWWGTFQWVGRSGINLTAGQHILRISADSEYFNVDAVRATAEGPAPDTTAPAIAMTTPTSGQTCSATIPIAANASDNVGVAGVQFYLDGSALGAEDTAAPYEISWDTRTAPNGAHTLTATARDAAGNRTTCTAVPVTVANSTPDTMPPSVAITAPANGASVSATIAISANASDNVGVAGVQFFVDGNSLSAEDTAAPYSASWNTAGSANGSHTLTAVARDAAGNRTTSGSVSVTVANGSGSQTPYSGSPIPLPGRFEGEDFDRGGEGIAYHDLATGNQGGLYRPAEDVDIISPYANGYVVNNFQTGEWLEYTINVAQSGTYRLEALVSSEFTTSRFHIEVGGVDKTGLIAVPSTGSWWTFQWVGKSGISLSAGQHVVRVQADAQYFNFDAVRASAEGPAPDTTAPTVTMTAPASGMTVSATIPIAANASDNVGVAGVQFSLDGTALTAEDTAAPYEISWDTRTAANGAHTLSATARDAAGNRTTSTLITVIVANSTPDTTAPSVAITAPANGATVSATISIAANASDNVGVAGVQFYVDGNVLGAEDTAAPYAASWTTTGAANGAHTLSAAARDAAGNRTTSALITVTVANSTPDTTAPSVAITAPANGATVAGTISIAANASDNIGVAGVQFYVDGNALGAEDTAAPYAASWATTGAANGAHTLSAAARDAAGNRTTSTLITVTVANSASDTTAPSVAITAPANGSTVSALIAISANASDNVGVVGVQFYVDGIALGAEDPVALYGTLWDTTEAANGTHTLTAVARDAAGNRTTSAPVTVTVANSDMTPPSVAITSPTGGVTVSGMKTISAFASDNVGVAGVQFYMDGSVLGLEDTAPPYETSWDTSRTANGSRNLSAAARDAAGNRTICSYVSVTVANTIQTSPPVARVPFSVKPIEVPGRIEAENFDRGGEGVAYHDVTAGNQGGLYRTGEDVDIITPYPGGYVVNNFRTGEWLEYTINVSRSGTYRIEALVSSQFLNSRFHIEVNRMDKTGLLDVPSTGSWTTFQGVGKNGISLTAGQHILRIYSDAEYFNLDAISVSLDVAAPMRARR